MTNQEFLLERTESYLKGLISELSNSLTPDFDSLAPFGELGLDSFHVLKIIKALEADFGTLPKTLLFENFNVGDLARYFVTEHAQTLSAKLAQDLRTASDRTGPQQLRPVAVPSKLAAEPIGATSRPILMLEKDAYAHPELGESVRKIFDRYKNDGSVSRGTRVIAPNLFIGNEKRGFFNYSRSKNVILAYAYTGPQDYFFTLAQELYQHCDRHAFELNLLTGDELKSIGDVRLSSTPFGVLQRSVNLQNFTLDGQAMRRLRYLVSKFGKSGDCRTEEFRCGSDPQTSRDIANMIDLWCSARTMVNPLIHIVKEEILAGSLSPEHRIFLTYADEVLQNVILISPLCAELNGYLMDLEFYHQGMVLGGLEFAIVKIIELLVAEGCDVFSLGGTYGCKLENSANADAEVDKILDDLRTQNIFNDEGNLQFKNKFRPENRTIFLCRPMGKCNPHNVIDIIMMIADPLKTQTSDEENHNFQKTSAGDVLPVKDAVQPQGHRAFEQPVARDGLEEPGELVMGIEGEDRSFVLAEFDFNGLNIPHQHIEFDLKTDSWSQLHMAGIENQLSHLHAQLQQPADLDQALKSIFPFSHFVLTTSGRAAESVFYKGWTRKGVVPQNLLFPTTIFHQIDNGFTPVELPQSEVFQLASSEPYKGNLGFAALQQQVERDSDAIAFVCIEVNDNGAGGYPVSIDHLKKVKALLAKTSIPLIIDGTRVLENARFVIEHEKEYAGRSVWEVAREILSYADALVLSLAKDFCVKSGGLIGTNDPTLFEKLQGLALQDGNSLGAIDKKLVALSLRDRKYIESQSLRRQEAVNRMWTAFNERGIPVVQPAGGHCVLIDVKQIPEFRSFKYPVASFLGWLYLETGVRAGAHNAGMQKNTGINELVRLAIPMGLKPHQVDEIITRIATAFANKKNIPEIEIAEKTPAPGADIHARYVLIRYHNPSGSAVAKASRSATTTTTTDSQPNAETKQLTPDPPSTYPGCGSTSDVAIVGMAGRYPKAKNLNELWENLVRGADCIEEVPQARLDQRLPNAFTKKYRGGFIDDIDKFDASFFGISAKDAEIMDPQERLFLEVAYEAIEDAGYYPELLAEQNGSPSIGVFVGAVWSGYQMLGVEEKSAGNNVNPSSFFWSIANRVSYCMNLSGPSLTLDTACSASLTAIKLACDAITSGECSAAIVGGVNLDLHQSKFDINWTGGSLSEDGVCRSFGKGANGYVAGEGVGALFLKPLAQAIADGDHIHGVIKSAVVMHSGKTMGYTVPSPHPQTQLVSRALEKAQIDARSIGYIEAHGTGTEFGDSIEISGLTNAFRKYDMEKQSCSIGSIKTNIGHLEAASGIVGVQKILLQMKHGKLVPSLHSAEPNENIDFENSPFYVQQTVAEWKAKEVNGLRFARRAGISTIGAGGASAHIILEEYEPDARLEEDAESASRDRIFPLSARTEEQLESAALRLRDFLRSDSCHGAQASLACEDDIAYTLAFGRKSFDYRLAVVAKTKEELSEKLTSFIEGRSQDDIMAGHVRNADAVTSLLKGQEKQDLVNLLVQSREPQRLARLWSDGVIAKWQGLEVKQTGKRIPLPVYPFARERYWIVDRKSAAPAVSAMSAEGAALPAARDDVHPGAARHTEKYHFSMGKDHDGAHARRSNPGNEEKAGLFVRQLFADQLKLSVEHVQPDARLMDTGVTSIDMAEMTKAIKDRFDPAFSPTAFFECMTLGSFANLLARKYPSVLQKMVVTKLIVEDSPSARNAIKPEEPETGNTDGTKPAHLQDAESELTLPDPKSVQDAHQGKPRCVFLTGATGFLGIHALAEFLNSDPEVQVVCLVRAADPEHGLQRILKQAEKFELTLDRARISALCADINQPNLGLSEDAWEACCEKVEQILHASAHVNHIEGYATFRESSRGIKEIIRLAASRKRKLIQFISSTAACAHKIGEQFFIFEKEDFVEDGEHVYGGYGQSKWVQETLLKRAHGSGIPYVIYRFGELSGSSRTGLGQTEDMVHRLLQMRLAVGCREKISNDVLDMVPVDFAAKLIVGTSSRPELWNRILHATHLKPCTFANLYRRAERSGLQFAPVTRDQYLAKCYDFIQYVYAINPVNGFVLECVLRDAEGSIRQRKIMDGYFAVLFPFAQDNFKRSLQALGLGLPEWILLLDCYLARWSRDDCGFMARVWDYQTWSQSGDKQKAGPAAKKSPLLTSGAENSRARVVAMEDRQPAALLENVQ